CIADVALAVAGLQAHPVCQLQRFVQGGPGPRPKGRALRRLGLHAVDGHQRGDVLQHLLLVGLDEGVYLPIQFLIHGIPILSVFFLCCKSGRKISVRPEGRAAAPERLFRPGRHTANSAPTAPSSPALARPLLPPASSSPPMRRTSTSLHFVTRVEPAKGAV